jgi:heme exporter protein A
MRLIAEGLACRRGFRLLFEDLSFGLGPGEALLVVGPNGAGKSSLLRILAGLLPATAGAVRMEGLAAEAEPHEVIHYLGHKDAARAALTPVETARYVQAVLGGSAAVSEALVRVGLGSVADLPVGILSAGQRRRLSLARLLTSSRPVWLLDEPTAALDSGGEMLLARLAADHRANGGILVAATHRDLALPDAQVLRLG